MVRCLTHFVINLIKKNISVKVLKEALGVKDDAEGAEYNDIEEANIGFEIESETSDKEADNYKFAFCQKIYIDKTERIKHMELGDVEENKESEKDRENTKLQSEGIMTHMEEH